MKIKILPNDKVFSKDFLIPINSSDKTVPLTNFSFRDRSIGRGLYLIKIINMRSNINWSYLNGNYLAESTWFCNKNSPIPEFSCLVYTDKNLVLTKIEIILGYDAKEDDYGINNFHYYSISQRRYLNLEHRCGNTKLFFICKMKEHYKVLLRK